MIFCIPDQHPTLLPSYPPTLLPSYPPALLPSYPPAILPFLPSCAPIPIPSYHPTLISSCPPALLPRSQSWAVARQGRRKRRRWRRGRRELRSLWIHGVIGEMFHSFKYIGHSWQLEIVAKTSSQLAVVFGGKSQRAKILNVFKKIIHQNLFSNILRPSTFFSVGLSQNKSFKYSPNPKSLENKADSKFAG